MSLRGIAKIWNQALICFLVVSMIAPSVFLCSDPHEKGAVKFGLCHSPACSASEGSFLDQTCRSREDVPNSMADVEGQSRSINPMGMGAVTSYSAKVVSLSRLLCAYSYTTVQGPAFSAISRPESAHRDNSCHDTIRTTILLI